MTTPDSDSHYCGTPKKSKYVYLKLPRNFASHPAVVGELERTRTSNNFAFLKLLSVILDGGGNLKDFTLNSSSIERARNKVRLILACRIQDNCECPELITLCWDGKRKDKGEECLAVVISGGDYNEGKIIGTTTITNGTGDAMADEIISIVDRWDVPDRINALLCDTTVSNTGIHKGVIQLLQIRLDKSFITMGCRHHILELMMKTVYEHEFG